MKTSLCKLDGSCIHWLRTHNGGGLCLITPVNPSHQKGGERGREKKTKTQRKSAPFLSQRLKWPWNVKHFRDSHSIMSYPDTETLPVSFHCARPQLHAGQWCRHIDCALNSISSMDGKHPSVRAQFFARTGNIPGLTTFSFLKWHKTTLQLLML